MIYRPGARSPERNSGGYCKSPEQCAGCNDGFYPDRAYCRSKMVTVFKRKYIVIEL